ncbi:MAG: RsmD family RNA methyltransferase [Treponemataceae bacterium]|nr:MAG: RsmD family RNA methyltransferase [Treponemataceae bacterium]
MKLRVEKIVAGGNGFSHFGGKAVFIPDALPDETIEAETVSEKKDFINAKLTAVLEASAHRVAPLCKLYGECGGCNLQNADYEYQLELKRTIIRDVFARAGIPLSALSPIPPTEDFAPIVTHKSPPWEYRSRIQLHRTAKNKYGFKSRNEKFVVPVDDCPIAVAAIRAALQKQQFDSTENMQRFTVFSSGSHVFCEDNSGKTSEYRIPILNNEVYFDIRGFFQSNMHLLEEMLPLVTENITGNTLLDLYCGSGVFALFSCLHHPEKGLHAKNITLVEQDKISLACAQKNFLSLAGNTPPNLFALSCKDWVKTFAKASFDSVIVDPPRSGLEPEVSDWLCKHKAHRICYVSCNPVTLARDSVKLLQAGYTVRAFHFFDFYPQTSHIECLICFSS